MQKSPKSQQKFPKYKQGLNLQGEELRELRRAGGHDPPRPLCRELRFDRFSPRQAGPAVLPRPAFRQGRLRTRGAHPERESENRRRRARGRRAVHRRILQLRRLSFRGGAGELHREALSQGRLRKGIQAGQLRLQRRGRRPSRAGRLRRRGRLRHRLHPGGDQDLRERERAGRPARDPIRHRGRAQPQREAGERDRGDPAGGMNHP